MGEVEELIRKYAVKNAYEYGRADPAKVLGKIISEDRKLKENINGLKRTIEEIVKEINLLSREELETEMKQYSFKEKKDEKRELTLPEALMGKVVVRFSPEPSGYLHIGHAKAAFLNYEATKRYNGRFILRFDDTNPKKEKQEFVDEIKRELGWLGIDWDKESYTSDYLPKIYFYAECMIENKAAYICECSKHEIKRSRIEKKGCLCRKKTVKENKDDFKKMLDGAFGEGEAVLRLIGDMSSDNTVMRDPTLMRVILAEHYRQGTTYVVWPAYDFSISVVDHLEKITHPMRSKEYELRDELYFFILKKLGLPTPTLVEFSRLSIKGMKVGKRYINPLIHDKKVFGYDDPRLPTLAGLRRRGIQQAAIKQFVLSFGISKVESEPTIDVLLSLNRKILDQICDHYFFVQNPIKLSLTNPPKKTLNLKLHPAKETYRTMNILNSVYIPKGDADKFELGELFRLKDFSNVVLKDRKKEGLIGEVVEGEPADKKIQFVPVEEAIDASVFIPGELFKNDEYNEDSFITVNGICEKSCRELRLSSVIQFERFGFCRLDKKNEKLFFIYSC